MKTGNENKRFFSMDSCRSGCFAFRNDFLWKFTKERERAAEKRMTTQPMDRATVIESETVVISVDSVAPDTVNVGR